MSIAGDPKTLKAGGKSIADMTDDELNALYLRTCTIQATLIKEMAKRGLLGKGRQK